MGANAATDRHGQVLLHAEFSRLNHSCWPNCAVFVEGEGCLPLTPPRTPLSSSLGGSGKEGAGAAWPLPLPRTGNAPDHRGSLKGSTRTFQVLELNVPLLRVAGDSWGATPMAWPRAKLVLT